MPSDRIHVDDLEVRLMAHDHALASTASTTPEVPEGYRLVPIEPTLSAAPTQPAPAPALRQGLEEALTTVETILASAASTLGCTPDEVPARVMEVVAALVPFAEAGRHIPASQIDSCPAAHVNSDARRSGTVTTIPVSDFRRAALAVAQEPRT